MRAFTKGLATGLMILLAATLSVSTAIAAEKINTLEKSGLWGYQESGVAIRGYDPVSYFTESKAVKGSEEHTVEWSDAIWHFSSAENANLFKDSPTDYAPQYGGYCAYGVAQDYLVKIEPEQWRIVDGKLYLNYDHKVQKTWLEDISGYIKQADEKFESLLSNN